MLAFFLLFFLCAGQYISSCPLNNNETQATRDRLVTSGWGALGTIGTVAAASIVATNQVWAGGVNVTTMSGAWKVHIFSSFISFLSFFFFFKKKIIYYYYYYFVNTL